MSDATPRMFHRMLLAGGAATALFAGFAAAPTVLSHSAGAREIVIAPPGGAPLSFADLIEKVSPAVVSIAVRQAPESGARGGFNPEDLPEGQLPPELEQFLRRFGERSEPRETLGLGSGFFISDKGVIVTNNHVVEGATEIKVKTADGKEYDAELVGADQPTDLAVVRIVKPDRAFAFVRFETRANVRVGDWVVAVGNPFGLEGTATAGIVSAKGRREQLGPGSNYVDFLQIDAPINRGNSGGPTFDLQGRVVGVNSAIYSPTGGSVGIGFAIPSETAAVIVDQLQKGGKVTRGWLGVNVQALDEDMAKSLGLPAAKGAMVAGVIDESPAAVAGLRQGDVILKVDGADIADSRDLTRRVGAYAVGKTARLDVLRGGDRRVVEVKFAERPGTEKLAELRTRGGPSGVAPGAAAQTKQAGLGLEVRPLSGEERRRLDLGPTDGGLYIAKLEPGADLARKGVRPGNIILQAGGQPVRTPADLAAAVELAKKAKRPVLLQIEGNGGRTYVAAEIKAS